MGQWAAFSRPRKSNFGLIGCPVRPKNLWVEAVCLDDSEKDIQC
jgi:hypothetical protein